MELDTPYTSLASWPASHRAAMVFIVHVDAPALEQPLSSGPPGLDYTASGFQRLLKAFADLDVPVTTAWTARAISSFPQLARNAAEAGHELAISHAGNPGSDDWEQALERVSEAPVVGCVASLPLSGDSPDPVPATMNGMRWAVTGIGGDIPLPTSLGNNQEITIIPVSPYWTDIIWLAPERPLPPSSLLEAWSLGLAAIREEGGLMTVILQPHISGRPGISGQIVRFIDEVIESGDVWIATAGQVTEWWTRAAADA